MHEDFSRKERVTASSDRAFGLTIGSIAALLALLPLLNSTPGPVRWWLLGIASLLAASAIFWATPLAPLNRAWRKLGLLLYKIVNPVVLTLLFYGCITPIGWLMRMTGKDPLRLTRDPSVESYWIPREAPPGSMKNQF